MTIQATCTPCLIVILHSWLNIVFVFLVMVALIFTLVTRYVSFVEIGHSKLKLILTTSEHAQRQSYNIFFFRKYWTCALWIAETFTHLWSIEKTQPKVSFFSLSENVISWLSVQSKYIKTFNNMHCWALQA